MNTFLHVVVVIYKGAYCINYLNYKVDDYKNNSNYQAKTQIVEPIMKTIIHACTKIHYYEY